VSSTIAVTELIFFNYSVLNCIPPGFCSSQSTRGLTEFEKYLQSQEELQKKQKGGIKKRKLIKTHVIEEEVNGELHGEAVQKKGIKRNSPLKKSILLPKKRQKKEKLGTNSSDDWWQVLSIINFTDW
jgi:hypothetical protein